MVKVLIVDDDQMQLKIDKQFMQMFSRTYEPITALNGEEAVSQYRTNGDIKLVILDTDLRPSNEKGWEIYDRLRSEGYAGPALARSAHNRAYEEWETRGVPFLSKDASRLDLEEKLNQILVKLEQ